MGDGSSNESETPSLVSAARARAGKCAVGKRPLFVVPSSKHATRPERGRSPHPGVYWYIRWAQSPNQTSYPPQQLQGRRPGVGHASKRQNGRSRWPLDGTNVR